MKISILTTITNPEQRQDQWREALDCYTDLANEVVVVNGGAPLSVGFLFKNPKIKVVDMVWPDEWHWLEYPKHLNEGKKYCTGDWILRLDIDQFIHKQDFTELKRKLALLPDDINVATMQKMSFTYGGKYYQKGGQEIVIKNMSYISFGENIQKETDLCFPVDTRGIKGFKVIDGFILPLGKSLKSYKTGISYWNYDYYFKTKEFTQKEFWRASRAYNRYTGNWNFGSSEEKSFEVFMNMMQARYKECPYIAKYETHPSYIRESVKNIKPEQFGYNGWGLL